LPISSQEKSEQIHTDSHSKVLCKDNIDSASSQQGKLSFRTQNKKIFTQTTDFKNFESTDRNNEKSNRDGLKLDDQSPTGALFSPSKTRCKATRKALEFGTHGKKYDLYPILAASTPENASEEFQIKTDGFIIKGTTLASTIVPFSEQRLVIKSPPENEKVSAKLTKFGDEYLHNHSPDQNHSKAKLKVSMSPIDMLSSPVPAERSSIEVKKCSENCVHRSTQQQHTLGSGIEPPHQELIGSSKPHRRPDTIGMQAFQSDQEVQDTCMTTIGSETNYLQLVKDNRSPNFGQLHLQNYQYQITKIPSNEFHMKVLQSHIWDTKSERLSIIMKFLFKN
jgi:hypothetical protein